MKYEDYLAQIEQDPEYIEGKEALRLRFALGDAVLFARINRGWSQTELARRVGTKQANISNIESGLANPTLDLVKRVADALELEVSFAPSVSALSTTSNAVYPGSNVLFPIHAPEWPTNPATSKNTTTVAWSLR